PRGSAHRYVKVGMALKAGVAASAPVMELAAAGELINSGVPAEQVQAAVDAGEVEYVAQAYRNQGTVQVPVPLDTHRRLRIITEAVEKGLGKSLPETAALCIEFTSEHAQEFGEWLKARGDA
ncbi:MAG: hypothetical protein ACR2J4_08740, partial [Deinococcus sp.]